MISLKDYAEKHHVSYEAIRKQVARYQKELKGHLETVSRTKYLDEWAEQFLDDKRNHNAVIVNDNTQREEYERAKLDADNMRTLLMEAQKQIIDLQREKMELLEEKGRSQLLIELKEKTENELDQAKEKIKELENENHRYKKSIFGLYRKKAD